MPDEFRSRVIAALASVGPGQIVSYGDLAEQAGYPGAARAVGAVLAGSRPEEGLCWWRVVYADGRLAPGHELLQARLLEAEAVEVREGRVIPLGGWRTATATAGSTSLRGEDRPGPPRSGGGDAAEWGAGR